VVENLRSLSLYNPVKKVNLDVKIKQDATEEGGIRLLQPWLDLIAV
jgi:hypothetical protein